tara:strand:+ start:101 stop:364 length:264 start_codon:yes stop_codon:yes gene_type:complete
MKPLKLEPREIDLVVASLEQALLFWDENIENNNLPTGFDIKIAESLYDDLVATYVKFANLQEEMERELEIEEEPLPNNVLKFPGDQS